MMGLAIAVAASLCASLAVADAVSYTNSELTRMADEGVVAEKTHDVTERTTYSSKSACKQAAGANGTQFMTNAHVIRQIQDTSGLYELRGWARHKYRRAQCVRYYTENQDTRWRLIARKYRWAKPKWSAEDDQSH